MSVPVLLLAIFIWFGLVFIWYTGNRFVILCTIHFADYNNKTWIMSLFQYDKKISNLQKSYNLILLFVIK